MAIQEKSPGDGIRESIIKAFNLGVWMRGQKGYGFSVLEAGKEIKDMIYWNMSQQYGKGYPDELIDANIEYFLQIAILGYILPDVSLPDQELKERLLALIEARAKRESPQSGEQPPTSSLPHY